MEKEESYLNEIMVLLSKVIEEILDNDYVIETLQVILPIISSVFEIKFLNEFQEIKLLSMISSLFQEKLSISQEELCLLIYKKGLGSQLIKV